MTGYLLQECFSLYFLLFCFFKSKGLLKQIEVKIIGKNERRFDRPSVIIKLKSEDKIYIHINIKLRSKST